MHTARVGGALPNLPNPAGAPFECKLFGDVAFEFAGDPGTVGPQLNAAILRAAADIIAAKLAANQVAIPTLPQSLPYLVPEIVAATGAERWGVRIAQLTLQVVLPEAAPAPAPVPLPPTPMQAAAASLGQAAADRLDPRNYNYQARVDVGGFRIKASTDGGLDTDGLKKQVADKAKSTVIWWGVGCLIVLLVGLGLLALGGYIYYTAVKGTGSSSGSAKAASWDGKTEFSCAGTDNVKLDGVTASLASGTAIRASGACRLEIVNCHIVAPTGIDAAANATVEVQGGSVVGTQFAAKAGANAKIHFAGTRVTGKTQTLASGKITGP